MMKETSGMLINKNIKITVINEIFNFVLYNHYTDGYKKNRKKKTR